ncbi:helix-turn-helix transcriptional regulator [Olivibacter sp. 47]|jgi:AraC-like DNA-binding protein|uniref:helix-turn-helix domain-containing protein n=1 Tax=unclassified Olivibacter TaxID=2632301 RepID=UPI001FF07CA9|nr:MULTISPECIES: helix-turn-helix transcriptional regulator [unclassified Olivibacter]MDM8172838.1 helix-turn-helix transcriptional regulator [Olivibacter sp. 47]
MTFVDNIFYKITAEMASDYEFKHDLICGYILELMHYALKMQPSERLYDQIDAKTRITHVFNELLERQFPIESLEQKVEIRSPGEYADKLGVHVNYLNKALRDTTGKTTSQHIADRLTSEAIALLKHSDWNIAEISYTLGFEDPSHFNHFFKKQTSQSPKNYRMPVVR